MNSFLTGLKELGRKHQLFKTQHFTVLQYFNPQLPADPDRCKYPLHRVCLFSFSSCLVLLLKSALQGPGLQPTAKSGSDADISHHSPWGISKIKRSSCLNVFFPFLEPCTPAGFCLAFQDNCWDVASPEWDDGLESVSHLSVLGNDFLQKLVPLGLHFHKYFFLWKNSLGCPSCLLSRHLLESQPHFVVLCLSPPVKAVTPHW